MESNVKLIGLLCKNLWPGEQCVVVLGCLAQASTLTERWRSRTLYTSRAMVRSRSTARRGSASCTRPCSPLRRSRTLTSVSVPRCTSRATGPLQFRACRAGSLRSAFDRSGPLRASTPGRGPPPLRHRFVQVTCQVASLRGRCHRATRTFPCALALARPARRLCGRVVSSANAPRLRRGAPC